MSTLIGASLPRVDAAGKVTGQTRYPADLVRPGMLHAKVVFAHRPHAQILRIDPSPAYRVPGVVAVLTADDVPYNAYGLISEDQPLLCKDVVRYVGDRVALVVAETPEAAQEAARRVVVEYRDLPVVSDPEAALDPAAPLVHPALGTNLLCHVPIRKGDITAGFAEADVVLEGEFRTPWQEHAYLQPDAGIAYIDEAGRVVVETAGQWLHEDRRQIAKILGLPEDQVVIRYAAIGGAFGGREDLNVQPLLALAAWHLKRPVALVWSREETTIGHHKRHPMRIRCRWGATKDGRIVAVQADVLADGGAYASTSVEVIKVAALFSTGCYEVPNVWVDGRVVYTNNPPAGAFRGFGAPQAQFAAEVMVTRLAHALGLDPVELRRRNIYREGSLEPTRHPLPPGVSAPQVLERCYREAVERLSYGKPRQHPAPHRRRGVALVCGIKNLGYSFGYPEKACATVELSGRGEPESAVVRVGAADVGQGAHTVLRQIAAETLGLAPERITLVTDDSSEAPNAGSASASRLTFMAGRAVREAALAALAEWQTSDSETVTVSFEYRPPRTTPLDPLTGESVPNYCYGYTALALEVEVDTRLGHVRVLRVISVHDVGRAINRQLVEGQIEGALAQALGFALLENFQVRDGVVLTPNFTTYLLPTALDMPEEIVPVILEEADPNGPFGARGVAELPLVSFAAAVAAAIYDAVGVWITTLPITPERVVAALLQEQPSTVSASLPVLR